MPRSSHRSSHRSSPRLRATLLAGAVLGVSTLTGASPAQATANVVDLETTVLRVSGAAVTGANVPAGRTLTPVRLTTSDPVSSTPRAFDEADGYLLEGPGRPAEAVTFRIDGDVVATSVPDFRYSYLQTDAGPIGARLFTVGGVTYALAQEIDGVTRTVRRSSLERPYNLLITWVAGLLPVGTQTRTGTAFTQSVVSGAGLPGTTGTTPFTVEDADNLRRNSGALGEELVLRGVPARSYRNLLGLEGREDLTTVRLSNGTTLTVRSLSFEELNPYGASRFTFLFDRAALAAAGGSATSVTTVVSTVPAAHDATWQELGADRI